MRDNPWASVGGTPVWPNDGPPEATPAYLPYARASAEGKIAKKMLDSLDSYSFNPSLLATHLVGYSAEGPISKKLAALVKALILRWAQMWDAGEYSETSRLGKRLLDALDKFEDEG